ncbi:MAG: protoporphyrinogen oxidase [Candidatus Melainabacteria bacterium]|nr:protoporphyrinogen oxidase [Candidatus Melainabacteria bacterium]
MVEVGKEEKLEPRRVAIIGGGISGLVTAYRLRQQAGPQSEKLKITLYEASPRLGGVIETLKWQDCLIESGPDSFITNKPFLLDLAKELNLSDRIVKVQSEGAGGALVYSGGRMHSVPDGFVMLAPSKLLPFAASGILSPAGKMRALMELVIPQRKVETPSGADESLANFVRRRFGAEVLDKLAQPMVAGIYVGDAEKLSAQSVAARFLEMEQTKGSVIRALMKNREKSSGARYGLFASFDGGIGTLVEALLANLPDVELRRGCAVRRIERKGAGYLLKSEADDACYDMLVLACPAASASTMLSEVNPTLSSQLAKIQSASSVVVNFVFEKEALASLEKRFGRTFGAVIPLKERKASNLTLIAFSFASNKYPLRAPDKEIIVRAFLGGVGEEETLALADDVLLRLAEEDLNRLLAPTKPAHYRRVHRWPASMPQYNLGHEALVAEIEETVADQPGLYLTGASYRGVGIPDCVNSANLCAKKLMAELAESVYKY